MSSFLQSKFVLSSENVYTYAHENLFYSLNDLQA